LLRVGSESTRVKAGLASYLLRVKSKLGLGQGPSLVILNASFQFIHIFPKKYHLKLFSHKSSLSCPTKCHTKRVYHKNIRQHLKRCWWCLCCYITYIRSFFSWLAVQYWFFSWLGGLSLEYLLLLLRFLTNNPLLRVLFTH